MRVALDTNVLVSGLLSPFGPPGQIARLAASGDLELVYDARILSEYRAILSRPRFGFDAALVEALMEQIEAGGHPVAPKPLGAALPDPDDEAFLEAALAGNARCLVTGNTRHYPPKMRQGVTVVAPKEFIDLYRREGL